MTSTSWRHWRAKVQMRTIRISHVDKGKGYENPRWREKMMQRRRNLIRVFTLAKECFIYKHVLSGPHAIARPINKFYNRS
jgi:hypothetical protein